MPKLSTDEILAKYGKKIESQFNNHDQNQNYSREYIQFKEDMLPEMSRYRRWANTLGNIIKVKVGRKENKKIQRYLDIAHLDVTPSQALTLAIVSFVLVFFLTILVAASIFLIN